jgi:hypothetical protein
MATLTTLPNGHLALNNNDVYTVALIYRDANGNVVPQPSGDTVSVSTAGAFAASLGVALGTTSDGNPAIVMTPLVVESDAGNSGGSISIVLTDSAGDQEDTATQGLLFDIILPPPGPPVAVGMDLTNIAVGTQPTPTAPGP